MRRGPNAIIDPSREVAADAPRASWYTPGLSDGLGDRLLMFDNTTASSLELLRFRPEFGDHPGFEDALRGRLDELAAFQHPSVVSIRAIKRLGDSDGLALVSNYVAGRRLSELLHEPRGAALALELVRQLTPVLALLEREGDGSAHGALTADRIVVTPEGRLVMVEHVLGPALVSLGLPAGRVRLDLGLAVLPDRDRLLVCGRADIVQLALMAVSLVLGRRVHPGEYPECVPGLLEEMRDAGSSGAPTPPLKIWLMRALHQGDEAFQTAEEAHEALAELLDGTDARLTDRPRPLAFPKPVEAAARQRPRREPELADVAEDSPAPAIQEPAPVAESPWAPAPVPPEASVGSNRRAWTLPNFTVAHWVATAAAVVAIVEALFIARLLSRPTPVPPSSTVAATAPAPSGDVATDTGRAGAPTGTPAATPPKPSDGARIGSNGAAPAASDQPPATDAKPAAPPVATIGGLRITSPIELQAFENGSPVGTTAGAMALTAGTHTLDLVNNVVGYRTRQVVQVKAGATTAVTVTPPNGRLSINATPWAEVFIDGRLAGETPLANLSVPLGEHQILFRHPQLGEQRQTAVVKLDVPARVSANLQR